MEMEKIKSNTEQKMCPFKRKASFGRFIVL